MPPRESKRAPPAFSPLFAFFLAPSLRNPYHVFVKDFAPPFLLRNPHAMTLAAVLWRRRFPRLPPSVPRLFDTEPGTQVRADCHWQSLPSAHPTLVLLHGLEGSSESAPILGAAEKAWLAGFNVLRLNQRNCGGTERLTPTLYHSGLSIDIRCVISELAARDSLPEIFAAGFSMGGNLVLKMAGEWSTSAPAQFRALVAIAPALDLAACADALARPANFIYERHFVKSLRAHMLRKASLFPDRYPASRLRGLSSVRTVRQFDDVVTAKFCGFRDASDYYSQSSARNVVARVARPALVFTAQDDPFVPIESFAFPALRENPQITFFAPRYGGHCGFVSSVNGGAGNSRERGAREGNTLQHTSIAAIENALRSHDRFWAESRIVEFCSRRSQLLK
ncbi:MAG TPA: alpha/beta fold hydrolase [Candidatus Micrarchaeaceae archaeon]|nr:alpha/beta fold hydrolase [Candidatus Micrarchaeaceae archaeon]